MLHLLKGSLGTGILAMPKAFYHSGFGIGIVATIIIGLFCTYCMRILVTCEYELCKRKRVASLSYPATAEAALLEGPAPFRRFAKASTWVFTHRIFIFNQIFTFYFINSLEFNFREILNVTLEIIRQYIEIML